MKKLGKKKIHRAQYAEIIASQKVCEAHRLHYVSSCPLCRRGFPPLPSSRKPKPTGEKVMSELKLKYDVRSAQKGGQIVARAGDIVDLIEMIGDHAIAQTKDGQLSFPLESDEYVIVTNDGAGITRNEDALYMSRGKGAK